eukprot:594773-Pyramimonas_sp.AAC.1
MDNSSLSPPRRVGRAGWAFRLSPLSQLVALKRKICNSYTDGSSCSTRVLASAPRAFIRKLLGLHIHTFKCGTRTVSKMKP